jgi:hypothetical protein
MFYFEICTVICSSQHLRHDGSVQCENGVDAVGYGGAKNSRVRGQLRVNESSSGVMLCAEISHTAGRCQQTGYDGK